MSAMAASCSDSQVILMSQDPSGASRRYLLPAAEAGWAALAEGPLAAEHLCSSKAEVCPCTHASYIAFADVRVAFNWHMKHKCSECC